jgi:ATP-dependent RNA circularization protein (DNA/RNA ligase family)
MDFLEELLILNNIFKLNEIADDRKLEGIEREEFIKKYNKSNNRLFQKCNKYMIDEYKEIVEKYERKSSAA